MRFYLVAKLSALLLLLLLASEVALGARLAKNDTKEESYFPRLPDLPVADDSSDDQFLLISTKDEDPNNDLSLIDQDVAGEPLSDDDDVNGADGGDDNDDASVQENDILRSSKDPIEGDLFEGDISGVRIVAKSDFEDHNATIKNAIVNTYQKWPNGVIPYTISQVFSNNERSVIYRAIKEFSAQSCITWIPRDPNRHPDFVHFLKDRGCYSKVGRMSGAQVLSLGDGCFEFGTVVHEMLHATGFWHEQSRPDRDEHVRICWENIQTGMEDNFAKYSRAEVTTQSLPYDVSSVMHYSSWAFSKNGRNTIEPQQGSKNTSMGQRQGFTSLDLRKLNTLYNCADKTEVQTVKPTTTTTTVSNCFDAYPHCVTWSQRDDGCNRYPLFMSRYCPKTCGVCSLPATVTPTKPVTVSKCADKDWRCPSWAAYQNQCVTNRQFMTRLCPFTCGLCQVQMRSKEVQLGTLFGLKSGVDRHLAENLVLVLSFTFFYLLRA